MAFAVFFVNSVLYTDVTVAELLNLETSATKVEIRIVFVGRNQRFFGCDITVRYLSAFRVADMCRLAEFAVVNIRHSAGIIKTVDSVLLQKERI